MAKRPTAPLLDQILQAWRINNSVNLKLIRQIPKKGFEAVPLGSTGRTVRRQLVHMHKVRTAWLRHNGVKLEGAAAPFPAKKTPSRTELLAGFRASGRAVEKFLKEKLSREDRVKLFQGMPVRFLCYLVSHDSHHRGQIALALKQAGLKLPKKVAINDVWYSWYGGEPSH